MVSKYLFLSSALLRPSQTSSAAAGVVNATSHGKKSFIENSQQTSNNSEYIIDMT